MHGAEGRRGLMGGSAGTPGCGWGGRYMASGERSEGRDRPTDRDRDRPRELSARSRRRIVRGIQLAGGPKEIGNRRSTRPPKTEDSSNYFSHHNETTVSYQYHNEFVPSSPRGGLSSPARAPARARSCASVSDSDCPSSILTWTKREAGVSLAPA